MPNVEAARDRLLDLARSDPRAELRALQVKAPTPSLTKADLVRLRQCESIDLEALAEACPASVTMCRSSVSYL